jgi:hypothetical protein
MIQDFIRRHKTQIEDERLLFSVVGTFIHPSGDTLSSFVK